MNALPKLLLEGLTLHKQARVSRIVREGEQWRVETESDTLGVFDRVLLTVPAPQALSILGPDHAFSPALAQVRYAPCWAAMLHGSTNLPWAGIRCSTGPLAWAGRQDTLPSRGGPERWVLHASPTWSQANLEAPREWVAEQLAQAFADLGGGTAHTMVVHRWRYSLVTQSIGRDHLQDKGLLYAGDGCLGGRIEAAWLSGMAAADSILAELPESG
jgi:predicted NAD/FAD-dependent oxidoreductase